MTVRTIWLVCKSGAATQIQKKEPRAILTHCYGHSLQLVVGDMVRQFGTQVKLRWSRGRKDRISEDAFFAPWYFSEMELEPAAG